MTLQQLKYIVAVAETGNITEAAGRLFVSQPSLTNAIRELESEMQITIFRRTNKGVVVSNEGELFLSYARQILEQTSLLEEKFKSADKQSPRFSVSCQHYSFAVNAFVDVIREFDADKYDFTLRETQTYEIIEDVSRLKSEIGILYTSSKNEEILSKLIKQNGLKFEELFVAKPHVFICSNHPLAGREVLELKDLEEYPYLSFEQGEYNSFYFSEEILRKLDRNKNIKSSDVLIFFKNNETNLEKCEFLIPDILDEANKENYAKVKVLHTEATWYGVTYKEDTEMVRESIKKLVSDGEYPNNLWG